MAELSFVMSTIALALYSISYFFNNKRNYLILQLTGNVFFSVSYMLLGAYFTMVSVIIGIARGLICYIYERKDKKVPILVVLGLCLATVTSYVIINYVILSQASVWDFLYLLASCMYSITFAIRNIRVMRYAVIAPHCCAIAYNLLIKAPISSAMSYGVELAVTLAAILKYELPGLRKRKMKNDR